VAATETIDVDALAPPAPSIPGVLCALPACLSSPLLLKVELDASFVLVDAWFLDPIRAFNPVPACVPHFRLLNDVDHSAEKDYYGIMMMETRTDAGSDSIVVPAPTHSLRLQSTMTRLIFPFVLPSQRTTFETVHYKIAPTPATAQPTPPPLSPSNCATITTPPPSVSAL
jgi:hypothetical protein